MKRMDRGRRLGHALALLVAAHAVGAGVVGLAAQRPPGQVPDRAGELRRVAEQVADRWSRGAVSGLAELMSSRGIGFHVGPDGQSALEPRKAVAALEDLLERRRSVSCTVTRVTPAGASVDRSSAELAWEAVAPGTSEVLRQTVFVGFAWEDARWRIYEIRILP